MDTKLSALEDTLSQRKAAAIAADTTLAEVQNQLHVLDLQQEEADAAHAAARAPPPTPPLDAVDVSDVALSGMTPPLSESDGEEAQAPMTVEEAAVLARHAPPVARLLGRREHVQLVRLVYLAVVVCLQRWCCLCCNARCSTFLFQTMFLACLFNHTQWTCSVHTPCC